jgi:WD repeat-containing protein 23
MKLWDLRKMMTSADIENIDPIDYSTGFDYRFEQYPDQYRRNAKNDCSVVTYRGHRVLKTLIRCHFSPPGSTNSRYVYSGSEDGKVYVYNLDATLAGTIDVGQATFNSRPRDPDAYATAYEMSGEMLWRTCVRDASWHPNAPVLAGRIYIPEHWILVGIANPVSSNFLEWLGLVYWHLYCAFLECRCC